MGEANRRGLHVESERWEVRISICQFFPSFLELLSFFLSKLTKTFDLQPMRVTIMLRITFCCFSIATINYCYNSVSSCLLIHPKANQRRPSATLVSNLL